jgi:Flp pilus assembly protein TadG
LSKKRAFPSRGGGFTLKMTVGRGLIVSIRTRYQSLRRRMRADARKGSAAIEFAFVAPVFFVLLLGIFESAIMFFSQAALQNAMTDMGRLIRTGQTGCWTTSGGNCVAMTAAQFRATLCTKVAPLIACSANLQVDVEAFNGYTNVNAAPALNGSNALNPAANNFQLGNACDVVLARAFYTWPVATPALTWFLVNMAGGKHLMTGATAFRNEPFTSGVSGC